MASPQEEIEDYNLDMVYYLFRAYMAGSHKMFMLLDADGDGHITEEELKTVFTDEEFDHKKFIKESDKDGDNKISFKEFISIMTQDLMEEGGSNESNDSDDLDGMTASAFLLCFR